MYCFDLGSLPSDSSDDESNCSPSLALTSSSSNPIIVDDSSSVSYSSSDIEAEWDDGHVFATSTRR